MTYLNRYNFNSFSKSVNCYGNFTNVIICLSKFPSPDLLKAANRPGTAAELPFFYISGLIQEANGKSGCPKFCRNLRCFMISRNYVQYSRFGRK